MSSILSRASSAVLSGVRKTTALNLARNSGVVAGHSSNGSVTSEFSTASPVKCDRIPTEAEIDSAIKEWEASIDVNELTDMEKRIHESHIEAIKEKNDMYEDPMSGFLVYTAYGHIKRGSCCGNACRHCPFQHTNVSARYKSIKKNNGAFYC